MVQHIVRMEGPGVRGTVPVLGPHPDRGGGGRTAIHGSTTWGGVRLDAITPEFVPIATGLALGLALRQAAMAAASAAASAG
jgi:hypothetical protein